VRIICRKEVYRGNLVWPQTHQGKYYQATKEEVTPASKGQEIVPTRIEDAFPAIIDQQTWDRVNSMPKKAHWKLSNEGPPLGGLLFCGRCGGVMYLQSLQKKGGQRNPNYICSTYHRGQGCGYCSVPQEAILRALADTIRRRILKGSKRSLEKAIREELDRRSSPVTDQKDVKKQIKRLNQQIAKAEDRLVEVDRSLVSVVERKLLDLQRQRDRLTDQKPEPETGPRPDPKKVAAEVWRLGDVFAKGSPSEIRTELSQAGIRVDLDFKPGKKHGRGQTFALEKATVTTCTNGGVSPAAYGFLVKNLEVEIEADQILDAADHVVRRTVKLSGELEIVKKILVRFDSRSEQIAEWKRLTGKGRRTFEHRLLDLRKIA